MYKIMFICHGNICRSPMAEFICKDIVKKMGRENEFEIVSSAVSTEEIWGNVGNPVYPPAKAELLKHGISCDGKCAQLLTYADGEYYDYLLCMDDSNVRRARKIVGEKNAAKCKKLLFYAGETRDVADPWYTHDFEKTYDDVKKGIEGLLKTL